MRWLPSAVFVALCSSGCAGAVPTLPMKHVVVYRNGVAYFERRGRVGGDRVGFRASPAGVSDVLATLAVTDPSANGAGAAPPPLVRSVALDPRDGRDGAATVVLSLDGKPHDLEVGYIAQAPIWKPSYRLMLHTGRAARLEIWGVVENASGEDWRNVELSLVTGAPIAYASNLDATIIPTRPKMRDEQVAVEQAMVASSTTSRSGYAMAASVRAAPARPAEPSAPLSLLTVRGSSTRYDLPLPVSIPDESESMVLVGDQTAEASQVLLYAPDETLAESATHPFRAVRFDNRTGGPLESGPVALFEDGMFLGQAVLEALQPSGVGTVSFALDRDLTVAREARTDEVTGALGADAWGAPTLERARVTRTTYHLQNARDRPASLLLEHPRKVGARLTAHAPGLIERRGGAVVLVPVVADPGSTDFVIEESEPLTTAVDWMTPSADLSVKAYLADPKSDPAVAQKLSQAWALRAELLKLDEERADVRLASFDLARAAQGPKRPGIEAQIAANARRLEDVEARLAALKHRFEHALADAGLRR